MNASNEKEKKEFLLKFCESSSILSFKKIFSGIMGKHVQCLFYDQNLNAFKDKGKKQQTRHMANFIEKVKKGMPREIQVFNCSCAKPCLFMPIIQGDNVYGCAIVPHLKQVPDKKDLAFMKLFIDTALREFQKEQELTRLYDTIRPRAIALSTIHTIHRLLSSTLDMNELIERITRLTLQVMRSKYCAILLLDEERRCLVPKAIVDMNETGNKIHKKHRRIKLESNRTEAMVARTGKTSLSRNSICVPLIEEDIIGIICAKNKTNNAPFTNFDMEILLTLAEQAVIALGNAQLYAEQERMAYGSIESLAALLDSKSPRTYTHSKQFVKIALAIAEEMRLPREEIRNLRYAALLPDTGKFSIPDEILRKQGGLSKDEFNIIKRQHLESLKILEPLKFLKPAIPIIMHHHERYDGSGYPDGLKGDEIPIGARIMAVADAFEAMISVRPYKDASISISQALNEIKKNKGTQFDPHVVDAFISASKKEKFKAFL